MTTQTDRNKQHNVLVAQARGSIFDYSGQANPHNEYGDTCPECGDSLVEDEDEPDAVTPAQAADERRSHEQDMMARH